MIFPPDFVDREKETLLLKKTISKKWNKRVLIFLVGPQIGKTYLMSYFKYYCQTKSIPVTLIDFDQRGKDPIWYWKFVSNIRDDLSLYKFSFSEVEKCEKRQGGSLSLIDYHPESGSGGIAIGSKGRINDSELQDWVGRDRNMFYASYSGTIADNVERERRQRDEMGRALVSDLSKICQKRRIVLILDTYEQASLETRRWIDEWLFEHLVDRFKNLVVVIAARPDTPMRDYVMRPRPWKSLIHIHEALSVLEKKHIREYLQKSKLSLREKDLEPFVVAAGYSMGGMAQLKDAYLARSDGNKKARQ